MTVVDPAFQKCAFETLTADRHARESRRMSPTSPALPTSQRSHLSVGLPISNEEPASAVAPGFDLAAPSMPVPTAPSTEQAELRDLVARASKQAHLNGRQVNILEAAVPTLLRTPHRRPVIEAMVASAAGERQFDVTDRELSLSSVNDAIILVALSEKARTSGQPSSAKWHHPLHAAAVIDTTAEQQREKYLSSRSTIMEMLQQKNIRTKEKERSLAYKLSVFVLDHAHRGYFDETWAMGNAIEKHLSGGHGMTLRSRSKTVLYYCVRYLQALSFAWAPEDVDASALALAIAEPVPPHSYFYRRYTEHCSLATTTVRREIQHLVAGGIRDQRDFQYAFLGASGAFTAVELADRRRTLGIETTRIGVKDVRNFVTYAQQRGRDAEKSFDHLWADRWRE